MNDGQAALTEQRDRIRPEAVAEQRPPHWSGA